MKGVNLYKVSLVGATGLVGKEFLSILEDRDFPVSDLKLYASSGSNSIRLKFKGDNLKVSSIDDYSGEHFDFAFFSAGSRISKRWVPEFVHSNAVVIDNTNAFRMNPDVPLVVPEVNAGVLKNCGKNIISNPNCSTIQMVLVLKPLDEVAKIKRVVVSTYQSVSGAGRGAARELSAQIEALLNFKQVEIKRLPHQIAFNCIPRIDDFEENAYTGEEMKMIRETSKIMGRNIPLTATCVRVPVFLTHAEAINVEFENELKPEKAREILSSASGVRVVDDISNSEYPLNLDVEGKDEAFVGRIRQDPGLKNALDMWVVADNLRRGAALNAIEIAEILVKEKS